MKRGATVLALVVLGAGPVLAQATFHGDVARSGAYPGVGPRTLGGVKWSFKTGGPVVGSPVVAGGVVYVASLDTQLYAIDQETGKEKWKFKSRLPIASTPAITEDTVFFVSSTGALAAIDRAAGTPKWVFVAEYEKKFEAKNLHGFPPAAQTVPDAWDLFLSSPAVAGGRVFFG
ncbi:MAG TPA: PQQ-binding-like beta-propeller repeat protein, partial [Dongiaceae bacterium]|nr:PQQ-binding-like beta-propeller repeat protein [Dongiaceae bacterium]